MRKRDTARFSIPFVLVACLFILSGGVLGQSLSDSAKKPPDTSASAVVVPVRTMIPLSLRSTVNTRYAQVGQAIYCETIFPITVGNRIVIPVGSSVKGEVVQVVRPGRVKGKAQLGLRFITLILPNGTSRSLRATLSGFGGTGKEGFSPEESKIEGASSRGEDAARVGGGAAEGAIIGGIAGRGKGMGIGAASGGAGGLLVSLITRGKDIVLTPGTSLELELHSPLTFDRDELDTPIVHPEGPALPRRDPGPSL